MTDVFEYFFIISSDIQRAVMRSRSQVMVMG